VSGRKPTHRVCIAGKRPGYDKSQYTEIGAAWENREKGSVSVRVNAGLSVVLTGETELVLLPADRDRSARREDDGGAAAMRDYGSDEAIDDIGF
jgi:hypothetical protein